jgi:hypothetical protein
VEIRRAEAQGMEQPTSILKRGALDIGRINLYNGAENIASFK